MALVDLAVFPSKNVTDSVYKWREKSDQCPQCRIKLSKEEPFLRDYILERIAEKYAKVTLSPEELVQREIQTTYPSPSVFINAIGYSINHNEKRKKMTKKGQRGSSFPGQHEQNNSEFQFLINKETSQPHKSHTINMLCRPDGMK